MLLGSTAQITAITGLIKSVSVNNGFSIARGANNLFSTRKRSICYLQAFICTATHFISGFGTARGANDRFLRRNARLVVQKHLSAARAIQYRHTGGRRILRNFIVNTPFIAIPFSLA